MADVSAYFEIAYRVRTATVPCVCQLLHSNYTHQRMIDVVPLIIERELLDGLSNELHDRLIQKLDLSSPRCSERCSLYLTEDPAIVATREQLLVQRSQLEKVQTELAGFLLMNGDH